MAKKKDNTLLYAGIAAAALLLFKKKDSGMAGVGASKRSSILIVGDNFFPGWLYFFFNDYIDSIQEIHGNESLISINYESIKKAKEELEKAIKKLEQHRLIVSVRKYRGNEYWVTNSNGEKASLKLIKGGVTL